MLVAVLYPLDRPAEAGGGEGHQHVLGVHLGFQPKPPPTSGVITRTIVRRGRASRPDAAQDVGTLVDAQIVISPVTGSRRGHAAGLERDAGVALHVQALTDDPVRRGERRVDVADGVDEPCHRRCPGPPGCSAVAPGAIAATASTTAGEARSRPRPVRTRPRRPPGTRRRPRRRPRPTYRTVSRASGYWRVAFDVSAGISAGMAPGPGPGRRPENASSNAGHRQRGGDLHRAHAGVRVRAAQHGHVHHAGQVDVVDEGALPAQEPGVLDALHPAPTILTPMSALPCPVGGLHGAHDVLVAGAAADVAGERLADRRHSVGPVLACAASRGGQQDSRGAEAALQAVAAPRTPAASGAARRAVAARPSTVVELARRRPARRA